MRVMNLRVAVSVFRENKISFLIVRILFSYFQTRFSLLLKPFYSNRWLEVFVKVTTTKMLHYDDWKNYRELNV